MKLFVIKDFYERYLGNVLIISLYLHLISSFLNKIINYFHTENYIQPITAFVKFVFFLFFLLILSVNYNKNRRLFIYLGIFFIVFILGNLKWAIGMNSGDGFFKSLKEGNIYYFTKYLYPFVFFWIFSLTKNKEEIICSYFRILEKFLIVNAFFVFLGLLFSIHCFQSYPHTDRFGYSGPLDRMIFVFFSMIVISRRVFFNKIDLGFMILCLAALLSGTKIMILFFTLLTVFYLYEKRKIRILYIACVILILVIVFFKPIINFTIKVFPFWQPILTKHGYFSVLLSLRDLEFKNTVEYLIMKGTLCNLFVGGVEFPKYWVEMDFFDLFLFFGVIGGTLYVFLLSKIINKNYHLIPLLSSFFVGGFLFSTIVMSTYFLWMYESHTEQKELFLN